MQKLVLPTLLGLVLATAACKKEATFDERYYTEADYELLSRYLDLPEYPHFYNINAPSHLMQEGLGSSQKIQAAKATFGRVLFYDKNLSKDRSISCASCHDQKHAFSDVVARSTGVYGRQTARNSYPLGSISSFATAYGPTINTRLFWDNRAATVAEQCRETLANPNEMDMQMDEVVRRVRELEYYEPLAIKAFGLPLGYVTETEILSAFTQFISALNALNTPFDRELKRLPSGRELQIAATEPLVGFNAAENRGKQLYMTHCMSCHGVSTARAIKTAANNGLDAVTTDPGIGGSTHLNEDMGTFKVPTLRNIELTGPYMHDGRFATLENVIEHYNSGIQAHPNLSPLLKDADGTPKRLNLPADDKAALIAFLKTLTDLNQGTDVRFADPFK
jgi:cytochrome c peroxidase